MEDLGLVFSVSPPIVLPVLWRLLWAVWPVRAVDFKEEAPDAPISLLPFDESGVVILETFEPPLILLAFDKGLVVNILVDPPLLLLLFLFEVAKLVPVVIDAYFVVRNFPVGNLVKGVPFPPSSLCPIDAVPVTFVLSTDDPSEDSNAPPFLVGSVDSAGFVPVSFVVTLALWPFDADTLAVAPFLLSPVTPFEAADLVPVTFVAALVLCKFGPEVPPFPLCPVEAAYFVPVFMDTPSMLCPFKLARANVDPWPLWLFAPVTPDVNPWPLWLFVPVTPDVDPRSLWFFVPVAPDVDPPPLWLFVSVAPDAGVLAKVTLLMALCPFAAVAVVPSEFVLR